MGFCYLVPINQSEILDCFAVIYFLYMLKENVFGIERLLKENVFGIERLSEMSKSSKAIYVFKMLLYVTIA